MNNVGTQKASHCWQAARECSVETNSTGAVLTEHACGTRHYLNTTAAIVYLLCDKCHSTEDIARFVAEQFSLDALPIDDVQGALDQLQAKGLIQRD